MISDKFYLKLKGRYFTVNGHSSFQLSAKVSLRFTNFGNWCP